MDAIKLQHTLSKFDGNIKVVIEDNGIMRELKLVTLSDSQWGKVIVLSGSDE